jgi:tetratricopeptide (TPR) repeat protein
VWDLSAEHGEAIADMESHSGIGTTGANSGAENFSVAQVEVQMHDGEAAALRLRTTLVDEKNVSDVAAAAIDRALLAEEDGDLKAASKEWDAFAPAYADPTFATGNPSYICYSAVTYEKTGQPTKADAALKPFGNLPLVDCDRFKGDVLDLRGDWPGAKDWYAKAVKLSPSIPSDYYSWGVALVKHGDLDGAAEKFKDANLRGRAGPIR